MDYRVQLQRNVDEEGGKYTEAQPRCTWPLSESTLRQGRWGPPPLLSDFRLVHWRNPDFLAEIYLSLLIVIPTHIWPWKDGPNSEIPCHLDSVFFVNNYDCSHITRYSNSQVIQIPEVSGVKSSEKAHECIFNNFSKPALQWQKTVGTFISTGKPQEFFTTSRVHWYTLISYQSY